MSLLELFEVAGKQLKYDQAVCVLGQAQVDLQLNDLLELNLVDIIVNPATDQPMVICESYTNLTSQN